MNFVKSLVVYVVKILFVVGVLGCKNKNVLTVGNKCDNSKPNNFITIPFENTFEFVDFKCKYEYGYNSCYSIYKDAINRTLEVKLSYPNEITQSNDNDRYYSWVTYENDLYNKHFYILEKKIITKPFKSLTSIVAVDKVDSDSVLIIAVNSQIRKNNSLLSAKLYHTIFRGSDYDKKLVLLANKYSKLEIK